jgi:hypothetical protein
MRKGVIRPRSFGAPPVADDDKYTNGKGFRGLQARRSLFAVLIGLFVLALMWFALGDEGRSQSVSVTLSVDVDTTPRVVDDSDMDDEHDEGDEDTEGDAEESDDKNEDGEEGEGEEGEGKVEPPTEEEDHGVVVEGEGTADDIFSGLASLDSLEHRRSRHSSSSSHRRQGSSFRHSTSVSVETGVNMPKLPIEAYFVQLDRKSVNISPSGSFKFVLLHAKDSNGDGAYIVQGCSYKSKGCKHPDAARYVTKHLEAHGIEPRVLGGGRITRHHLRKSKKAGLISIFGYSRMFGRCEDCNKKACVFIAQAYPDYVVRWSNQGYSEGDEYSIKDWEKCSEDAVPAAA